MACYTSLIEEIAFLSLRHNHCLVIATHCASDGPAEERKKRNSPDFLVLKGHKYLNELLLSWTHGCSHVVEEAREEIDGLINKMKRAHYSFIIISNYQQTIFQPILIFPNGIRCFCRYVYPAVFDGCGNFFRKSILIGCGLIDVQDAFREMFNTA